MLDLHFVRITYGDCNNLYKVIPHLYTVTNRSFVCSMTIDDLTKAV